MAEPISLATVMPGCFRRVDKPYTWRRALTTSIASFFLVLCSLSLVQWIRRIHYHRQDPSGSRMMLEMRGHDTQNALPALGGITATMAIIWTQACNWDWEYAADPSNGPRIPEASIKKWMFLLKLNLVLLLQVLIKIPSLRNMVDAVIEELSLHRISTESIILLGLLFATAVAVILGISTV
jgi:hypothetical protein